MAPAWMQPILCKEEREMRFMAAMNGVDLDESSEEARDVATLQNPNLAAKEGFGAGEKDLSECAHLRLCRPLRRIPDEQPIFAYLG